MLEAVMYALKRKPEPTLGLEESNSCSYRQKLDRDRGTEGKLRL